MYYSQLQPEHKNVMKALQADTETKIKTLIDVSKWSVQKFETSTVGKAYRQLNKIMNGYTRCVLDQNITGSVLSKSRELIIKIWINSRASRAGQGHLITDQERSQFKSSDTSLVTEFVDSGKEPTSMIKKDIYSKLSSNELIKRLRHVVKHSIFEKWLDVSFIENKNTEIISKVLDEWEKKQSSQRRDLSTLFKFLKSQGLSASYQRLIEANRTSKYLNYEELSFLYCHPSIEMSDSMRYILTRNEFYFYKNFEMLLILSNSYQINEDIKNHEIGAMKNLTASLYYKLLSYSKNLNNVIESTKTHSVSSINGRFKHALILEQIKEDSKTSDHIEKYEVLNLPETRQILSKLVRTLEKINSILDVNMQKEIEYYTQVKGCILTKYKATVTMDHIEDLKTRITSKYGYLCSNYSEDIIVDLLNELDSTKSQLETCSEQ